MYDDGEVMQMEKNAGILYFEKEVSMTIHDNKLR